jgi:phenylpropionate dioxygenase-like ring-hydroxylating dioxygenase large terminal subunit
VYQPNISPKNTIIRKNSRANPYIRFAVENAAAETPIEGYVMTMSTTETPALAMPRNHKAWYVICSSKELRAKAKPLQRKLYGRPIVVWRSETGVPAAAEDRCPHRNAPLSFGTVCGEHLQCAYHGWEFDTKGGCQRVPTFVGEANTQARSATAFPVREQQGFVWMWGESHSEPDCEPYTFPFADKPGYLTVRHQLSAKGSLHSVAENALDVPHTAFLHRGLFRNDSGDPTRLTCVLERTDTSVVCEYQGESRPEGIVAWLLAPSGGEVTHFDRFHMPCVVEVEYALGEDSHIINAAALTPVDDFETILYAVISVRTRIPNWIVKPLVQPLAMKIFAQDAKVLALQTETVHAFGESKYVSTEVDLLGPHILRLLHRAASETATPSEPYRTVVEIEV